MRTLIDKTLYIAKERFASFGFNESQIDALLASAQEDLGEVLTQLQNLFEDEKASAKQLAQTLHALKGLFYNMGNTEAGDLMVELESEQDKEVIKTKIEALMRE